MLYAHLNKWVFKSILNESKLSQDITDVGSEFQRTGAACWKALSPALTVLLLGISNRPFEDDRRDLTFCCGFIKSEMYCGAFPCNALKTKRTSLYSMRKQIGSQWSSSNIGVMWLYLLEPDKRRAAAFWTSWSFLICTLGTPYKREFMKSSFDVIYAWMSVSSDFYPSNSLSVSVFSDVTKQLGTFCWYGFSLTGSYQELPLDSGRHQPQRQGLLQCLTLFVEAFDRLCLEPKTITSVLLSLRHRKLMAIQALTSFMHFSTSAHADDTSFGLKLI